MEQKTQLANALHSAGAHAMYDYAVKNILANKEILAWILKSVASEFVDYEITQIIECIEGEPQIAEVPVYPGHTNIEMISGLTNEDTVPNEGKVTFDIRFFVRTLERERIKLLINVEAQKSYYPGYDLVTRGIYYGARMLSAQKDREFVADDYDGLKKVYSIWICMGAPDRDANTVTEYSLRKRDVYGLYTGRERYDLLSVVMIRIGRKITAESEAIFSLLNTLLTSALTPDEKEAQLLQEFGILTTREVKEGLDVMCNLSYGIAEDAMLKKAKEMVVSLYKAGVSLEIISEAAKVTIEEVREWLREEGALIE